MRLSRAEGKDVPSGRLNETPQSLTGAKGSKDVPTGRLNETPQSLTGTSQMRRLIGAKSKAVPPGRLNEHESTNHNSRR